MMGRRTFVAGVTAISLTPPRFAWAQQTAPMYRLAVLHPSIAVADMNEEGDPSFAAFFKELRRLGYVDGANLLVERWSGDGEVGRYESLMAAMITSQPDVIFAPTGTVLALRLSQLTRMIPIVFIASDPVPSGLVASLAKPGGNATGVTTTAGLELYGKLLGFLHEAVPNARRIAYLGVRRNLEGQNQPYVEEAAAAYGVTLVPYVVVDPVDERAYRRAFAAMGGDGIE